MTRAEAVALYQNGLEPTVAKLLELSAEKEQLQQQLQQLRVSAQAGANENPVDPARPSAMTPAYEKPSSKGKRRKTPGRKPGHIGVRRKKPDHVDRVKEHKLERCPYCHTSLRGKHACETRSRYIEDLPQTQSVVVEHRIYRYYCRACDKLVEAPVTAALPNASIGLRTLVFAAWLHYGLGITVTKITRILNATAQFKVTASGLFQAWYRLAEILKSAYHDISQQAKASAVLSADETGWRVGGITHWLHCLCNQTLAFFGIERSRGSPATKKLLGEFFRGILVSDFWGGYNFIKTLAKQKCLVHLLRELVKTSLTNTTATWCAFSKKLTRLVRDAIRLRNRADKLIPLVFERRKARLKIRLQELIHGDNPDKDCKRLVKRLRRHLDELLTFLDHPEVDWHNNQAERQLRPAVVARKNSGGNHSDRGAETQAMMMTIFFTLQLRGQDQVNTVIQM
ncbi:MAG: IS66 family transposase, partial [bacterium]